MPPVVFVRAEFADRLGSVRIIAGEFRGRILQGPESDTTRPITDRVKQSLFDILTPHLPDSVVYDVFAGTGSMGLESISRGARRAVFFEADRSAHQRLKKNIATLDVSSSTQVIPGDLFRWFAEPKNAPATPNQANLIFLDPPYRLLREDADRLQNLAVNIADHHLAPDGIVIFRHGAADTLALPPLAAVDVRTYGGMTLEFLRKSPV